MTDAAQAAGGVSDAAVETVDGPPAKTPEQIRRKLEAAIGYHERDLGYVDDAIANTEQRLARQRAEADAAERAAAELAVLRTDTLERIQQAKDDLAAFDGGEG